MKFISACSVLICMAFLDNYVDTFDSKVCQCIHLTATYGFEWGSFNINSNQIALINGTSSGCLILFIVGASNEIVEVQFNSIKLRAGCIDQIKIYSHLKEPLLDDLEKYEEKICMENAQPFLDTTNSSTNVARYQMPISKDTNPSHSEQKSVKNMTTSTMQKFTKENFYIKNNKSIYSSDKIFAIYFPYKNLVSIVEQYEVGGRGGGGGGYSAFEFSGKFKFHEKVLFEIDGYALPTTYCDYQFLPYSMSMELENGNKSLHSTTLLWRYFYSPRYPAKYPRQIKCSYKFIGRCLQASDKITIYDSKTPNKTQIIDVFCNNHVQTKILSNGPYLLIEFESSGGHTSRGFRGKYRFMDFTAYDAIMNSNLQDTTNYAISATFKNNNNTTTLLNMEKSSEISTDFSNKMNHIIINNNSELATTNSSLNHQNLNNSNRSLKTNTISPVISSSMHIEITTKNSTDNDVNDLNNHKHEGQICPPEKNESIQYSHMSFVNTSNMKILISLFVITLMCIHRRQLLHSKF